MILLGAAFKLWAHTTLEVALLQNELMRNTGGVGGSSLQFTVHCIRVPLESYSVGIPNLEQ